MQSAVADIPHNGFKVNSVFNFPGCNDYVTDKCELARDAFTQWIIGKTKHGIIFKRMRKSQAVLKLALWYCKNHIKQIKTDIQITIMVIPKNSGTVFTRLVTKKQPIMLLVLKELLVTVTLPVCERFIFKHCITQL